MSTKYVIVFTNGCNYRAHKAGCSQARTTRAGIRGIDRTLIEPETFDSVAEARAWADADESNKAGEPTKARFKACACTRK